MWLLESAARIAFPSYKPLSPRASSGPRPSKLAGPCSGADPALATSVAGFRRRTIAPPRPFTFTLQHADGQSQPTFDKIILPPSTYAHRSARRSNSAGRRPAQIHGVTPSSERVLRHRIRAMWASCCKAPVQPRGCARSKRLGLADVFSVNRNSVVYCLFERPTYRLVPEEFHGLFARPAGPF